MKTLQRFSVDIRKRPFDKLNPTNSFRKFLELPIPLREKIYEHTLDVEGQLERIMSAHGVYCEIKAMRQPFFLPAFCLTSKTECIIATGILLQNAKFSICCEWCGKKMLDFLDRLPGNFAHDAVRHLIYDHYARKPSLKPDEDDRSFSMEVMQCLPRLERLQIIFPVWDVIELKGTPKSGLYRPLTVDEIIAKKAFTPVMNCGALQYFHVLVVKAEDPRQPIGNAPVLHEEDVMNGLLAMGPMMAQAFGELEQNPRIRFTHSRRDDPRNNPSYSHRATVAAAAAAVAATAAITFPIMTSM